MFIRLVNFIRGYVIVAVTGFSVERFINLAARRGVNLWDARLNDGHMVFRVSVKTFRQLRPCAKKCGCKIRIIKKTGLPFLLYRYRKRQGLLLGALVFVGLLYFMTSFVWLVTVEGNDRTDTAEIMSVLDDMGVSPGVPKRDVDLRAVERGLMSAFSDMAWVNVFVKGTRVYVKLVETLPQTELADDARPCDVVAQKDGVIVSIATETGRPLVRPGDVVKAGDVLVSGEIVVGSDDLGYSSYFVRANSAVRARRYYEYRFDVPLTYIIKSFTGNITRNYGIILFDRKIYLRDSECPFVCYDKVTAENRLSFGADYPLPALYFTETYREFIPTTVHRSIEEAELMGRTIADARLARELPDGTEVVGEDYDYSINGDVMSFVAVITVIEPIGEVRDLENYESEVP